MLNIKSMNHLLTQNTHPELYSHFLSVSQQQLSNIYSLFKLTRDDSLMTTTGTLLGYSLPVNMRQIRDQAALMSQSLMTSTQHDQKGSVESASTDTLTRSSARAITVQAGHQTVIARRVKSGLYLVLSGLSGPSSASESNVEAAAEAFGGIETMCVRRESDGDVVFLGSEEMHEDDLEENDPVLSMQRKKLDHMAHSLSVSVGDEIVKAIDSSYGR